MFRDFPKFEKIYKVSKLISGLPNPAPRLPCRLCQSVLGSRNSPVIRGGEGMSSYRQRLVMANPLHRAVGLDSTFVRYRLVLSSFTLVARSKGANGRRQERRSEIDESRSCQRKRLLQHCRHDETYY